MPGHWVIALLMLAASPGLREAGTRTAAPGAQPPPAKISDLAWLAGSWEGEGLGARVREVYSPPTGGQMVGHFLLAGKDGVVFSEILNVAEVGHSLEYRLKHFHPDLTGWEEKNEVIRFPLVAVEGDSWHFDGLTLRRDGADRFIAIVRIGEAEGRSRDAEFRYRRSTPH